MSKGPLRQKVRELEREITFLLSLPQLEDTLIYQDKDGGWHIVDHIVAKGAK